MNEKEKSLKLADMMGWRIINNDTAFLFDSGLQLIMPYDTGATGLSQFAAILLKFPEVMSIIVDYEDSMWAYTFNQSDLYLGKRHKVRPTQANILDEILSMNGVAI